MIRRPLTTLTLGLTTLAVAGCISTADMAERTSLAENGILDQRSSKSNDFARIYRYYPEHEVYHSAWQDRYYWLENTKWVSGTYLPAHIDLSEAENHLVRLYTARPYTEHETTLALFPPAATSEVDEAWVAVPTD